MLGRILMALHLRRLGPVSARVAIALHAAVQASGDVCCFCRAAAMNQCRPRSMQVDRAPLDLMSLSSLHATAEVPGVVKEKAMKGMWVGH